MALSSIRERMILITGAAGYVGRAVVAEARKEGFPLRAVVRNPKSAQWLAKQYGVDLVHGNLIQPASLAGCCDGVNCVIHLVGIINEWKENTFQRVHVDSTVNILDEAKRAGVKRFIHMSALGARPNAVSRYHQTKWEAEEAVRKSGLAWTIFRPSLIYGAGDRSVRVLAKLVRLSPFVPVIGNGQTTIQPVPVELVAQAFLRAIRNDSTVGKVYDLVGPEPFTWNELYDKLLAQAGRLKPKIHIPIPIARIQGAVMEKLSKYPPLNREQVIMAQENNAGDPAPAVRDMVLEQETFEMGLRRYLGDLG